MNIKDKLKIGKSFQIDEDDIEINDEYIYLGLPEEMISLSLDSNRKIISEALIVSDYEELFLQENIIKHEALINKVNTGEIDKFEIIIESEV